MSHLFTEMEAVKVKVKKFDGPNIPVHKKFSVDPRITSFDVLRKLVARAFEIKGDFTLSYLGRDESNKPTYSALLSDWDLDAALLSYADPCLRLKVEIHPPVEGFDDWEVICPVDLPVKDISSSSTPLRGGIFRSRLSSIGKSMEVFQKAFGIVECSNDERQYSKMPMTDSEYRNFLDSEGHLIRPLELRRSIFLGGLDPHLRKYVWRSLLNVFPDGLSGQQRLDYMKTKSAEYIAIRDSWKTLLQRGEITHQLQYITNLVKKDVLRTDRSHKMFAGSDENKSVIALFNILTSYAVAHPSVSYCQGMSDLASPLLVVMKDEAHAYICFCGLMKRMKRNFRRDGVSITVKFDHLRRLLQHYDHEFYDYLTENQSDDLLFCYRWLLVELKREFAFDDALRALEIIWSSLPPDPPATELELMEPHFSLSNNDTTSLFDLVDYKCGYHHPHSCTSKSSSGHSSGFPSKRGSGNADDSSSDDSSEYVLMNNSLTQDLNKELRFLEDSAGRLTTPEVERVRELSGSSMFLPDTSAAGMDETLTVSKVGRLGACDSEEPRSTSASSVGTPSADDTGKCSWPANMMDSGILDTNNVECPLLPPPHELGDGNPFLIFVCLTILLQHRDYILNNKIQHHFELAMYFDKMIKRHNLQKILLQARKLFAEYLKSQQLQRNLHEDDASSDEAHNF